MGFSSGLLRNYYKGKVNVKFTLEQAAKAQRGSVTLFFNLGARWGWVVNATPRPLYPQERLGTLCTVVQEAGWAAGPVWTGAEYLAPAGIRSPDSPASSESLYRLRNHDLPRNYYMYKYSMYIYIYMYVCMYK